MRIAARDQRIGVVGLERQRAVEAFQRRGLALERDQQPAAQGQGGGVIGLEYERALDAIERFLLAFKFVQDLRAVEQRVGMIGFERERAFEAFQRGLRAAERVQRIAAVMQRLDVIGFERQRAVIARQRFLVARERGEHAAQVGMGGGGAIVAGQRLADEFERLGRLAGLMLEHAVEMQGVELIGAGGEHGTIERLGLAQLPALMQRGGAAQRYRRDRAARFAVWFADGPWANHCENIRSTGARPNRTGA